MNTFSTITHFSLKNYPTFHNIKSRKNPPKDHDKRESSIQIKNFATLNYDLIHLNLQNVKSIFIDTLFA